MLEQLNIHMQKKKNLTFTLNSNHTLIFTQNTHTGKKVIKLLEENNEEYVYILGIGKCFLNMTQNPQTIKKKTEIWNFTKI